MPFNKFSEISYDENSANSNAVTETMNLEKDIFPIVDSRALFVNFSGKTSIDTQFEVDSATFFNIGTTNAYTLHQVKHTGEI